jgi:asparagine synthase (glutamine-hydrolysing)
VPLPEYFGLLWPAGDEPARRRADALSSRAEALCAWTRIDGPGWRLWASGAPARVTVLPAGRGGVIGDYFPAGRALERLAPPEGPIPDLAKQLLEGGWGRYVALLGADDRAGVFRDPSGQLDALTWSLEGGVQAAASGLAIAPPSLWPSALRLDWAAVGRFLAAPGPSIGAPLFDGLEALLPGELLTFGPRPARRLLWRPADHALDPVSEAPELAAELVHRVDDAAAALVGSRSKLIVELSGGLDSAIVAGSLAAQGLSGRVAQWLNGYADRPEGDERAYARSVTERLGCHLTVTRKSLEPLTEAGLAELAGATWPAINGCDASRDRDEVARIASTGAEAIVSGQGGDAIFFQMPTPLVVSDALRARGPQVFLSPLLPDVARRMHASVWSVLGAVLAQRRTGATPKPRLSYLASDEAKAAAAYGMHPWLQDARARGVLPGKQLQVAALGEGMMLHGDSRRRQAADLLYPLLAQPVVELCLRIPAFTLAGGAFDRPFARAAFADRLPDAVRLRRAKGELNSYHSRLVAGSLGTLRPYLLDGVLCGKGVLDRAAVEAALDPASLIWRAGATEIFWAATAESWARFWQARLSGPAPSSPRRDHRNANARA